MMTSRPTWFQSKLRHCNSLPKNIISWLKFQILAFDNPSVQKLVHLSATECHTIRLHLNQPENNLILDAAAASLTKDLQVARFIR